MFATPPSLPEDVDIIVAGGGPAGSTIARLLARLGFHVVVLEKRHFPRHQIGESLTPHILPILDFLGVRQHIEAAGFLRMIGHTVCWGSNQPRTAYYSPDHTRQGFQVWREDFDQLLLHQARNAGVEVFENLAVSSVAFINSNHVEVRTRQGKVTGAFFIDATGHAGVLARHGLRRRDSIYQTLALTGYWQNASNPQGIDCANTLLETYEHGLVWSVPLHNGLRNVTLLVDWGDGSRIRRSGKTKFYLTALQSLPYIGSLLPEAQLVQSPVVFDASWYMASSFAGECFLLVGDAGLFIDPLSSEGVHKAMASAITGAAVVNTILKRPAQRRIAIAFYEDSQRTTYDTYYQQAAQYYREEQRWPAELFWQQRSCKEVGRSTFHNPRPEQTTQPSSFDTHVSAKISSLQIAPDVMIQACPVIEGPYVELREAIVTSRYPRGIRFLQGINIPQLLQLVRVHNTVAEVIRRYVDTVGEHTCSPEEVRQVLARLYHEGILTSAGTTTTG
ncbi:MAG: NAD(P)/FAD-dependent oxidoreductase [Candidatus Binatia bacterium]